MGSENPHSSCCGDQRDFECSSTDMWPRSSFTLRSPDIPMIASPMELASLRVTPKNMLSPKSNVIGADAPQDESQSITRETHKTPPCSLSSASSLMMKRPRLQPRRRSSPVSRLKVDTAPQLPSAEKMDLPVDPSTVAATPTSASTARSNDRIHLPIRYPLLPRNSPVRLQYEGASASPPASHDLPVTLNLPDLPEIDCPSMLTMIRDLNATRPPRFQLQKKPLPRAQYC